MMARSQTFALAVVVGRRWLEEYIVVEESLVLIHLLFVVILHLLLALLVGELNFVVHACDEDIVEHVP